MTGIVRHLRRGLQLFSITIGPRSGRPVSEEAAWVEAEADAAGAGDAAFDFASDEKPEKNAARQMMLMLGDVNVAIRSLERVVELDPLNAQLMQR